MEPARKATGVKEVATGVFELKVPAGKDPLTGRYRQVTRRFRGTLREAKTARAELLAEVSQGKHVGARATVDELFIEWLKELERKDGLLGPSTSTHAGIDTTSSPRSVRCPCRR